MISGSDGLGFPSGLGSVVLRSGGLGLPLGSGSSLVCSVFTFLGVGLVASFCCGACSCIFGVWAIIVTPLIVKSEPIQPMTPRYIMRMHVATKGANASPKVSIRSSEAIIDRLFIRKP